MVVVAHGGSASGGGGQSVKRPCFTSLALWLLAQSNG